MLAPNMLLFAGNSNIPLAKKIADCLNVPLSQAMVSKFEDGEVRVQYSESIQGKDIILLQSTSAPQDTHLMELLLLADAACRGFVRSITAIVPYLGYARQDKCVETKQVPISAKLIAKLLKVSGIERLVTINLHSDQIQGFFEIPVHNLYGHLLFVEDVILQQKKKGAENFVVVSPDSGGMTRAAAFAEKVNNIDVAFINKKRPLPNTVKVLDVVGDVQNKDCILIDDIIDTGGTLIAAAEALKKLGANRVMAYCVHPVLSGLAVEKIAHSMLDELVVADTIILSEQAKNSKKIRQFSVAPIISDIILEIARKESKTFLDVPVQRVSESQYNPTELQYG